MGIGNLPTEIILHILNDSLASLVLPTSRSRLLMGVCRRWHDIITSAPEFWTDVWVLVEPSKSAHFYWILWRLTAQLARCKRALINVRWQVRISEAQTRDLMEIFGKHAPFERWKSLYIVYHDGVVPDVRTSLSPLGVFRSLETLRSRACPPNWILDYIDNTLPPTAPLREFECYRLDFILRSDPGALSNILHTVKKLRASRLIWRSRTEGLPANIMNLNLENLDCPGQLDLSHITTLVIQISINAEELAFYPLSALMTLDVAFNNPLPLQRLVFPALLELRIRGDFYQTLSYIDAPKLRVLILDGKQVSRPRRARETMEDAFKSRWCALKPTRELEIGMVVSDQILQTLLDRSPALEKLSIHMIGREYDLEVARLLLPPTASLEDERCDDNEDGDNAREVEWKALRHNLFLSDEEGIAGKPRGQNLCSLTVFLEQVGTSENVARWERWLRRFEDAADMRGGGERNVRFECSWKGRVAPYVVYLSG